MRTAKEIRQYIKQQRWYNDFKKNIEKYGFPHSANDFLRGYYKENTISGGFFWQITSQGVEYWGEIEKKFCYWYKKGGKKYDKRRN